MNSEKSHQLNIYDCNGEERESEGGLERGMEWGRNGDLWDLMENNGAKNEQQRRIELEEVKLMAIYGRVCIVVNARTIFYIYDI